MNGRWPLGHGGAVLLATTLALTSALLHAGWNVFVKTSDDRELASWGQFLAAGILVLPALAVLGLPPIEALPYLTASALIHVGYVVCLVMAYTHGDFSLSYPLARGGGAVAAAIGGALLLGDTLPAPAWLAIGIAAAGLVSLAGLGATASSVRWALLTAGCIAAYTLVDANGSRVAGDGVRYGFALMPLTAVTLSVTFAARGRASDLRVTLAAHWWRYAIAGVLLTAAYTLVLVAVRHAPVGHVTMLRESSVVMAALIGWLALDEQLGHRRLASALVVTSGLVLLVNVGI